MTPEKRFALRTNIVLENKEQQPIILDTKWKRQVILLELYMLIWI